MPDPSPAAPHVEIVPDVRLFNVYAFTKQEPEPDGGDWRRDHVPRYDLLSVVAKAIHAGFDTILVEAEAAA